MSGNTVGVGELLAFISPAGQQQIVDFIARAKAERGQNWLPEIKAEFPTFAWIVELIAGRNAEEAFEELQSEFPHYPLSFVRPQLISLHGRLRAEIEKPR